MFFQLTNLSEKIFLDTGNISQSVAENISLIGLVRGHLSIVVKISETVQINIEADKRQQGESLERRMPNIKVFSGSSHKDLTNKEQFKYLLSTIVLDNGQPRF